MNESKHVWVSYGGSNRKLNAHLALLKEKFGNDFQDYGSLATGGHHSNHRGVIPDNEESRAWVKSQDGIRIARRQP